MSDTQQGGPGDETDDAVEPAADDSGSDERAEPDGSRSWAGVEQFRHLASDREPASGAERRDDGGGSPSGGGDIVGEPLGSAVSAPRGFAIIHVGLIDDDREWARSRERLSADVYTRQVALRYAAARAKGEPEGGYLALIDPNGRCAGVFTAGSGRVTGPETMKRVKRVLQKNGQTRKRTSRPSKRTSR